MQMWIKPFAFYITVIVSVIAFTGEPAHACLYYSTNAITKENKNFAWENTACKNLSTLIFCTYLPSHQVLHRTQITHLKAAVLPAVVHPFFALSAHLSYNKRNKWQTFFFHNSALFAHFPALFLGSAEWTYWTEHILTKRWDYVLFLYYVCGWDTLAQFTRHFR